MLCTAPNKYSVVDSTGAVKPQCCVDMWVFSVRGGAIIICWILLKCDELSAAWSGTEMCERATMASTTSSDFRCRSRVSEKLWVAKRWRPRCGPRRRRTPPAPGATTRTAESRSSWRTASFTSRLLILQVGTHLIPLICCESLMLPHLWMNAYKSALFTTHALETIQHFTLKLSRVSSAHHSAQAVCRPPPPPILLSG